MHTMSRSLIVFGMLGMIVSAATPAGAGTVCRWLPGDGLPGVLGSVYASVVYDDGSGSELSFALTAAPFAQYETCPGGIARIAGRAIKKRIHLTHRQI